MKTFISLLRFVLFAIIFFSFVSVTWFILPGRHPLLQPRIEPVEHHIQPPGWAIVCDGHGKFGARFPSSSYVIGPENSRQAALQRAWGQWEYGEYVKTHPEVEKPEPPPIVWHDCQEEKPKPVHINFTNNVFTNGIVLTNLGVGTLNITNSIRWNTNVVYLTYTNTVNKEIFRAENTGTNSADERAFVFYRLWATNIQIRSRYKPSIIALGDGWTIRFEE